MYIDNVGMLTFNCPCRETPGQDQHRWQEAAVSSEDDGKRFTDRQRIADCRGQDGVPVWREQHWEPLVCGEGQHRAAVRTEQGSEGVAQRGASLGKQHQHVQITRAQGLHTQ